MLCLEEKKLSRVMCITNDQLPTLTNTMATVSTNCLNMAHFSPDPINAIITYNWIGNFVRNVVDSHNPGLRMSLTDMLTAKGKRNQKDSSYKIAALYLDPSLGGVSGMALTRINIRMFPDPITESLSFWRGIYLHSKDTALKHLALRFGNLKINNYQSSHFEKLLVDPASLNIYRGLSAMNLVKNEIRRCLMNCSHTIENTIIRESLIFSQADSAAFSLYLESISPIFPQFISEWRASTYHGIAESLIGLFSNSRTIRSIMKRKFQKKVDGIIYKSECLSVERLLTYSRDLPVKDQMWACSSAYADSLRKASWCRALVGTTVPHPFEMLNSSSSGGFNCSDCSSTTHRARYISVIIPSGLHGVENSQGPLTPYMGSQTAESTSVLQPWETETKVPFLTRAAKMRSAICWFVGRESNLAQSLLNNMQALSGEDPGNIAIGFKRTGSALHRFSCSRVSNSGFIANSPLLYTRMIIFGDANFDFMHQYLMLCAQQKRPKP